MTGAAVEFGPGGAGSARTRREAWSAWGVVLAYAGVVATTQVLWLTFAAIDTEVARDYGVSHDAVGWLANVFPLVYVVLAIPAGLALDRWFRRSLLVGAGLTAAGGLVRLVGPTFDWLLAGQLVIAVAQPLVLNALTKTASAYLPAARRATGIAIGSAAQFLGAIIALVMGPALEGHHGVDLLLVVQAGIGCAAFVILATGLRRAPDGEGAAAGIGIAELRAAWEVGMLRVLSGLAFVGVGIFVALSTYLQPLLHRDHISSVSAGLMLAGMLVAGIIGCGGLAPLVQRREAERTYLSSAVLLVTVFMALLALLHHIEVADYVLIAATGFFLLTALPVMLSLIERRMAESGGVATGVLLLAGNAGGLVVAIVVGELSDYVLAAFLVLAAAGAIGLPFARRVPSGTG